MAFRIIQLLFSKLSSFVYKKIQLEYADFTVSKLNLASFNNMLILFRDISMC